MVLTEGLFWSVIAVFVLVSAFRLGLELLP